MIAVHRIRGDSMFPLVADGDYVVSVRLPGTLRPDDRVVVDHPDLGTICKRVAAVEADGSIMLRGENSLSTDSARLGAVARKRVLGKVMLTIRAKRT